MRLDVRQLTRQAASAELRFHDTYIALVAGPLVRELAEGWSAPLQLQMIPSESELGVVEIQAKQLKPEDIAAILAAREETALEVDPPFEPKPAAADD